MEFGSGNREERLIGLGEARGFPEVRRAMGVVHVLACFVLVAKSGMNETGMGSPAPVSHVDNLHHRLKLTIGI